MATVALSGIITPTNVVTAASTTTLTNKTIAYASNTLTGVAGTGVANTFSAAQELATGTAIASASTVNLDTATGNRVHITGTTTITAVTLTRGPRTVIFDGILTLTHNATTNNLPSAANITTAAGDRAIYESDGTTVYCVSYIKANGTAVVAGSSSVGNHVVVVTNGNGHGSTNTTIRRFTTTLLSTGTAITYADSSANGASFTINDTGLYSITYTDRGGGTEAFGVSRNSTQLTTGIATITAADRLASTSTSAANTESSVSIVRLLTATDIIRAHDEGSLNGTGATVRFSITKVGS